MEKINSLLSEIKKFYENNAPAHIQHGTFIKATEKDINEFEQQIGEKLPDDYICFLLNNDFAIGFDQNFDCMSIEQVVKVWKMMKEHLIHGKFDDGRVEYHEQNDFGNWDGDYIQKVWWSDKWIPFCEDSCGNMKCIDLANGKNGQKYQIISMEIQDGQGPFISEYSNFSDYLEHHLKYLKEKKYTIEEFFDGSPMICVDSYIK